MPEEFKRKAGQVLTGAIAGIPVVGGPLTAYWTQDRVQELQRRADDQHDEIAAMQDRVREIADVVDSFRESAHRCLLAMEADGQLDRARLHTAFQLIRFVRHASRALCVEDEDWRRTLALSFARLIAKNRPPPDLCAEIDRAVLDMEPHDTEILRGIRETLGAPRTWGSDGALGLFIERAGMTIDALRQIDGRGLSPGDIAYGLREAEAKRGTMDGGRTPAKDVVHASLNRLLGLGLVLPTGQILTSVRGIRTRGLSALGVAVLAHLDAPADEGGQQVG